MIKNTINLEKWKTAKIHIQGYIIEMNAGQNFKLDKCLF